MERYDVLIVGAGISGLSLAHYCAKSGLRVGVLEKGGRAGGCFQSHRAADDSGFWLELGSHTCYNSYGNLIGILEDCGLLDRLLARSKAGYKMYVGGRMRSIPSQMNFVELITSLPKIFSLKKSGLGLQAYYGQVFGAGNFKRVFEPAFNAVICQEANSFPAEMLFKKRPRRKEILKSFTLAGGLQTVIEGIVAQGRFELLPGQAVETIAARNDHFEVMTGEGTTRVARAVALAAPPSAAAGLLTRSFPDLAARLARIRVVKAETVGVVVRKEKISLPPLAGIIGIDEPFYSLVSRDVVPHQTHRGFSVHFKPGRLDHEGKLKKVAELLGTVPASFDDVASKENIVPAPLVGHEAVVRDIDRLVAGKRLLVTGNYFAGLAIEDCISRSLSEYARLRDML